MRRLGIAGLALVTCLSLAAVGASSAVADEPQCLPVVETEAGNEPASCSAAAEGPDQGFVRGMIKQENKTGSGEYCIWVLPGRRRGARGWRNRKECLENGAGKVTTEAEYVRVKDGSAEDKGGSKKTEFSVLPTGKKIEGFVGLYALDTAEADIVCTEGTHAGEITSMDSIGKVSIHLTGCQVTNGRGTCTVKSQGAPGEGLILTNTLRGLLGTVKATEALTEVGLLLEPESGKTITTLAATAAPCETLETLVTGSVAGEVDPVTALALDVEVDFEETSSGKQQITAISTLSGTVKPSLAAFALAAEMETIDELDFEADVEIS